MSAFVRYANSDSTNHRGPVELTPAKAADFFVSKVRVFDAETGKFKREDPATAFDPTVPGRAKRI